jgi:hypothetical protein
MILLTKPFLKLRQSKLLFCIIFLCVSIMSLLLYLHKSNSYDNLSKLPHVFSGGDSNYKVARIISMLLFICNQLGRHERANN